MNKKIINIINMLGSVNRNHDMGLYPAELIQCICEALNNICTNKLVLYLIEHSESPNIKLSENSVCNLFQSL